jgi:hypothetical protein
MPGRNCAQVFLQQQQPLIAKVQQSIRAIFHSVFTK